MYLTVTLQPVGVTSPEATALAVRFAGVIDMMRPDAQWAMEMFLQTHERGMMGSMTVSLESGKRRSNPEVEFSAGTKPLKIVP